MEKISALKEVKCPECGGEGYEVKCTYCGNINERLVKLNNMIPVGTNLETYYNDFISGKLANKTQLTEEEDKFFYTLLKEDLIKSNFVPDGYILISSFLGKKLVSYKTFEKFVELMVRNIVYTINDDKVKGLEVFFEITDLKEDIRGTTVCKVDKDDKYKEVLIKFDRQVILGLYEGKKLDDLETIFHETTHILQNIYIATGVFSAALLKQIKDKIIREYCIGKTDEYSYYDENYYIISSEVDARLNSILQTKRFLGMMGYSYLDENLIEKRIEEEIKLYKLDLRKIDEDKLGVEQTALIDEIFDKIVEDKPELLEKYPQLKVEYVLEDGFVRRKNYEELLDTYEENLGNDEVITFLKQKIHFYNQDRNGKKK